MLIFFTNHFSSFYSVRLSVGVPDYFGTTPVCGEVIFR